MQLDPLQFESRYFLGRIRFQQGRHEDAAELFDEALAAREDYQAAFFGAQAREALGSTADAAEHYQTALEVAVRHMDLNPDDPRAATMRAVSLCRLGRLDEGKEWAERALVIDPADAGVRYNVACLFALETDPERAIDCLEEAIAAGAYQAIGKVIEEGMSPEAVIEVVKGSGLRGRGGAGFPTGLKWSFTASGDEIYIVCNADEGEPGTFKDRLILEGDPHRLIEGMMIAAYAVGSSKGYVYIRGEYHLSIERMQKAIDDARTAGLLGAPLFESEFSFDVEIKVGAGAYVCGEETALIESIEGKRGYPRLKPPYPGTVGLWSKPTVVNNVETLANVPPILLHGAEWFRSFGTESSPGTKVFMILGHVAHPGLIEVEMGTPLRTILEEYGGRVSNGKGFKAALIGGAAGAFVPECALDVAMDFEGLQEDVSVLGSGAILVLDEDASIPELLHGILRFFRHESCGQCAPCRAGMRALVAISERLKSGGGAESDLDVLLDVVKTMQATSLCPLGQSVILPVKSALEHFGDEFSALFAPSAG